jgi:hypothetical protein
MISLCRTAILTLHRARRFARIVDGDFCRQQLADARNCSAAPVQGVIQFRYAALYLIGTLHHTSLGYFTIPSGQSRIC